MKNKIFALTITLLLFVAILQENVFADYSNLGAILPENFPTSIDDENSPVQWIKKDSFDSDYVATLYRNDNFLIVGDQNIPLSLSFDSMDGTFDHMTCRGNYNNTYYVIATIKYIGDGIERESVLASINIMSPNQDCNGIYVPLKKIESLSITIDDSLAKLGAKPSDIYNSVTVSDNVYLDLESVYCHGMIGDSYPFHVNPEDELKSGVLYYYSFEIYPNEGYTFEKAHEIDLDNYSIEDKTLLKSVKVNGIECPDYFEFDEFFKGMIYYSDYFAFYDVIEGQGLTIKTSDNKDVSFKSNVDCSGQEEFSSISVCRKENLSNVTNLIQDSDYEISDDYKTITIKKEFLSKLEADTYDLTINYKYGKATTSFEIIKEQKPEPTPKPEPKEESHSDSGSSIKYNIPKTGIK